MKVLSGQFGWGEEGILSTLVVGSIMVLYSPL